MTAVSIISQSNAESLDLVYRGKVRDIYKVTDDKYLLVATDRISAFDCILPTPIEHKGRVLTQLSAFWFDKLKDIVPNHLITSDFEKMPDSVKEHPEFSGRSMLVKKATVFPVECVVRGYLEGSGWKDYKESRMVCGRDLPKDLKHCDKLLNPIFTPATKAETGHDENINQVEFMQRVGHDTAAELKRISKEIYAEASKYAIEKGIIIADTKFEFGTDSKGNIMLIDEVLTPDSSRFWDASKYEPGHAQASFDKQFVREYLETLDWDKTDPAPPLPDEIAEATSERYMKAFELLTGKKLPV